MSSSYEYPPGRSPWRPQLSVREGRGRTKRFEQLPRLSWIQRGDAVKVWILLFPILLFANPGARLDPHGKPGMEFTQEMIKSNKECTVCHSSQRKQPVVAETCFNCHNRAPHSGVAEHLSHNIKCLDCHSPHRAKNPLGEAAGDLLKSRSFSTLSEGLIINSKPNHMLRKSCTDCHQWDKIK